jgi:hypothetical protein
MKIFFCPLQYLDDRLLIDTHRGFHAIENNYKKNKNTNNKIVKFIYGFKDRINWFNQYHERLVTEMDFRFGYKEHKSPVIITPKLRYTTWKPPLEFIEDDINYLKHRFKFANKEIKYTNRDIPEFLKDIERAIHPVCDDCIYFSEEYDKKAKRCYHSKLRKTGSFCESWDNGKGIKFRYEYKSQILKDIFGGN